jgi:hypothetical protein
LKIARTLAGPPSLTISDLSRFPLLGSPAKGGPKSKCLARLKIARTLAGPPSLTISDLSRFPLCPAFRSVSRFPLRFPLSRRMDVCGKACSHGNVPAACFSLWDSSLLGPGSRAGFPPPGRQRSRRPPRPAAAPRSGSRPGSPGPD